MYCYKCGTAQKDGVKFCGACGSRQPSTQALAETVSAKSASPAAPLTPAPARPAIAGGEVKPVTIDTATVTAKPQGSEGEVLLDYKVLFSYTGPQSVPLTRLKILVSDARGWPLLETESLRVESEDIEAEDAAEVEGGICLQPALFGTTPEELLAGLSLMLYPVSWQQVASFEPPSEGAREGSTTRRGMEGIEVLSWSMCLEGVDEDSARYSLSVHLGNRGSDAISVALARLVIRSRKGKDLVVDTLYGENIAPGEARLLTTTVFLYENAAGRRGAKAELAVAASMRAVIIPIDARTPEMLEADPPAEEDDEEVDESDDDETQDGDVESEAVEIRRFGASMKWFDVADQPPSAVGLPAAFAAAARLWRADAEGNIDQVLDLLSPFVKAVFIPSNIDGHQELFTSAVAPEYEATEVRVVGVDFRSSPIPACKAEAYFLLPVRSGFDDIDLAEWQIEHAPLSDAVAFRWDVPANDATEGLDLTHGDHKGCECWVAGGEADSPHDSEE